MISWNKPGLISSEHPLYHTLVLVNILLTSFFSVLSTVNTIVSDDNIQGNLALSDSLTVWLTTLNLLGVNTTVPAASWFADRFGYKTMYMAGVGLFMISTAIAGFATNFATLGVARVIEGIGSGIIFPVGLTIIQKTMPPKKLPLALILYVGAIFGGGFALGLPLCAYFAQFYSWRDTFFLMVPLCLLGLLSCALFHEETEKNKTYPFDIFGFFFFALFFASLLVALTEGPLLSTNEGWRSPFILSCFGTAFISLIATIYIEMHSKNPIIPIQLFKDSTYTVTCCAMFLLGMSIFASATTMIQYMVDALAYERFVSGKIGIIYGVSLVIFSILANAIIKKIPVPVITFLGLIVLVYSYFLNNILDWQTGPLQILLILFLRGVGLGLSLGPATIRALRDVPKELASKAATFLTFFRQVGATYGGTLIAIIVIKRRIFHAARFGEQSQTELPGYQVTFQKLYSHFHSTYFDSGSESSTLAKAAIIKNIENQAYIQAINDSLIIFGYVTLAVALVLAFLNLKHWIEAKNSRLQEKAKVSK